MKTRSFFLAAGFVLALEFTVSCNSSDQIGLGGYYAR